MAKYLIDANLPYYFALWNNDNFIHVKDINDQWNDDEIWQYALLHNLIIISKDSDFSNKLFYKGAPPKVIHLKFGNLKMRDFHANITKNWIEIENLIAENNLLNVYLDKIEAIK